ncbi:MAG: phosphohistidine phosphatase SixA [Vicinamibacterales bacterium]
MVQLYLIRHAIAEERSDAWPDDTLRPLTDTGQSRMRKIAKGLVRLGVRFDVVLTSPLVRARQTAEIVAAAYEETPTIVDVAALGPDASHAELLTALKKHARKKSVALVGHEPDLGTTAARLIGSRKPLELRKGAVCRIDVTRLPPTAPGALRWFATPSMLARDPQVAREPRALNGLAPSQHHSM